MPKVLKKASGDRFVLCPQCSEAAGEEVYVHKTMLEKREGGGGFWSLSQSEPGLYCSKGHKVADAAEE